MNISVNVTFGQINGLHGAVPPGGFSSRGAKAVDGYSEPPPPSPYKQTSNDGNAKGNNNQSTGIGSGSGNGRGPEFYCTRDELARRGHTEDVINCVTQSGLLSAWATSALNEEGKAAFGERYIQQYRDRDYAFRGKSQASVEGHRILRFYEKMGLAGGSYHASIDEMQRKAQLRFNAASHDTSNRKTGFTAAARSVTRDAVAISVSVQKYLDLPSAPYHSAEARFTPTVVDVEISRTVSGKQQVVVAEYKKGLSYSNERNIGDLFDWLKFKPGS